MKTLNPILRKKTTSWVVGFVAAMLLFVAGYLSVQNGSSRLAAAAVVESETQPAEKTHSAKLPIVEEPAAEGKAAPKPTVVENRMTEEARATAKKLKSLGSGEASYYGAAFAGRPTANGETFDPALMTAAHRTLPFGTKLRVTNADNGRSVVVRVNDRGPYADNRVIDLSRGAAEQIGMIHSGTADVKLEVIS